MYGDGGVLEAGLAGGYGVFGGREVGMDGDEEVEDVEDVGVGMVELKSVKVVEPTREELMALYWEDGLSLTEISERVGMSRTAVYNRMRGYGIGFRARDHKIRGRANYMHPENVAARGGGPSANPMYGRRHSEESRAKMREAWARRKARKRGEG